MSIYKTFILLCICSLLMISFSMAQDEIVFLSGRVMTGLVKEVDSMDVRVEVDKGKKKKLLDFGKHSIFAIKYGDGKTDIFYEQLHSEEYSIREMELFIKGEQDAMKHVKAPILFFGGIVVGGASMVGLGPFYGFIPLVPYSIIGGALNSKIKENATSDPDLLREDTYITGYVTKAKSRKIQRAFTGSIIGYVSGLVAIAIAAENKKD